MTTAPGTLCPFEPSAIQMTHDQGRTPARMFGSAVLAGAAITLMTWMQQGASTLGGRIVAVVGNILGGVVLVTMLRLVQAWAEAPQQSPAMPDV